MGRPERRLRSITEGLEVIPIKLGRFPEMTEKLCNQKLTLGRVQSDGVYCQFFFLPADFFMLNGMPNQTGRRGLSLAEEEAANRQAALAYGLGGNSITTYGGNQSSSIVVGAGGSNPIRVNNVAPSSQVQQVIHTPCPGVAVVTPQVVHMRCGVTGCTQNHTQHRCRRCNGINVHLTRNCDVYCGLPGCTHVHKSHHCRSCRAVNAHFTRNCPLVNGGGLAFVQQPPLGIGYGQLGGYGLFLKR